ncbi:MAG: hypothetical protein K2M13_09150 [Muribaculaceae bacterium]|nr:hypothetical protein [Muribaculaceae bacterium]
MTAAQEKELLEAIYDRLLDAVTYQPEGGKNPLQSDTTLLHFTNNAAVKTDSFTDLVTPSNPNGNLRHTEEFSRMVNVVPALSTEWFPGNDSLSDTYRFIVNSANSATEPDPKAVAAYEKAYEYLHPLTTIKNPFTGEETTERTDSAEYLAYEDNMDAYVTAITTYRASYNIYLDTVAAGTEEEKKKADRDWQVTAPRLENEIKKTFRQLQAGNGKFVEMALDILATTVNDGVRMALKCAQEAAADSCAMSSSLGFPSKWYMAYPVPGNWAHEDAKGFSEIEISGKDTTIRNKETSNTFSVDGTVNYGLWRVKADASGEFKHSKSEFDMNSVKIKAKVAKVQIMRPWFMESIFRLSNWTTDIAPGSGKISNGKIDDANKNNYLPLYPVAFIVAKDIEVEANFSHEDQEKISEAAKAGTSVGWGPFSIGGSYAYGKTDDHFHSSFRDGKLTIPGMQIMAWVSKIIPFSTK